jgi:hypothetical protein
MLPLPAWIAIAAAVAVAIRASARGASAQGATAWRAPMVLLSFAAVWTAVVAAMAQRGYAGLPRFLFMASALEAVVAGVGAAWLVDELARIGPPARARIRHAAIALAACAAFALGSTPAAAGLPADTAAIDKVADMDSRLADSVDEAAGVGAVLGCRTDAPWYTTTALAYDLDVQPRAIHARCPIDARRPAPRGSDAAGSTPHGPRAARS